MKYINKNFIFGIIMGLACFVWIESVLGFEFPKYELDCILDVENHILNTKQRVIFTNNSNKKIDAMFFHLYPHRKYTKKEREFMYRFAGYFKINPYPEGFQGGDLKIKNISKGTERLSYKIEGDDQTILKVELPSELAPQETIALNIDFQLEIPHAFGRFGWNKDIIALGRWYPILSVLDEEGWHNYPFYPYHQPFFSDSAFYKVRLTLPKDQVVVHTGYLKDSIQRKDGNKTLLIETDFPVRDFSFAISPHYKKHSINYKNIKINSFYLAEDEFYGRKASEFASELMDYYTENFGNYPYKEFNIAPVYLGYGGGQSSNLIFIDTRVYKLPKFLIRYFDFLISHETGHQWFYNIVGSDEYKEMWIDEGINSFFILSYLDEKYGEDAKVMVLPKGIKWLIPNFSFRQATADRYIFLAKNGLDRPVLSELSSFKEPSSIFALAYGKGAMVVSMLKSLVGDEVFNKIMRRYFSEFRFSNIKVEDLIRISEQESKQDLKWFFDQWLKTDKICDYAIKEVNKKEIVLENRGEIQMPIKTKIEFSDGSIKTDVWNGRGRLRKINIDDNKLVKTVRIDSKDLPLDIDKTNNVWPRSLYVRAVPLYFFAYDLPTFLNKDSYNLIYGPALAGNGIGIKSSLQKSFDSSFYTAVGYDISDKKIKSNLGYELQHIFDKQMSLGFEVFKNEGLDDKEGDLDSGKIYLRRELWPASYGLGQINDHITFYIIRNQKFDKASAMANREDVEHLSYLRKHEAIVGMCLQVDRSGPYPDPVAGFKFASIVESAGHFLGGKEAFDRIALELSNYFLTLPRQKIASRLKLGLGSPSDKNIFELGSDEGLRGYGRKDIRGSHMLLGSLEYRFPLLDDINYRCFNNIINFKNLQGVLFFDIGKSWFGEFGEADFKKDAGFGLRFHINIGEFLEKIVVRLDLAQAINESKEDPRVWLGINHTF